MRYTIYHTNEYAKVLSWISLSINFLLQQPLFSFPLFAMLEILLGNKRLDKLQNDFLILGAHALNFHKGAE